MICQNRTDSGLTERRTMHGIETVALHCPYCGEPIEVVVDASVEQQSYVEDCPVCCQPMVLDLRVDEEGNIEVTARRENE